MKRIIPKRCSTKHNLTNRERKLIKGLAAGMTQQDAALAAGYSAHSIRSIASQIIAKPKIQTAMQQALEKAGLSNERLASVIDKGIDANKVISANVIAENGEGMKDANSMTKDFVEVPDWIARHKFTDTALKLKSAYPAEQIEHSGKVEIDSIIIERERNND